ncbi:MAG: hypothetical protein ACTHQM_11680 [Thermoanaerobaculia bacterium]
MNDIVTGVVIGLVTGKLAFIVVPPPDATELLVQAGLLGLAGGFINQPVRWLLNLLRDEDGSQ